MSTITFDYECTTWSKGSPFDKRNKAVCLGLKYDDKECVCHFDDFDPLFGESLGIAFNAKFDVHWLRREGRTLPKRVWCTQIGEFLLSGQKERYPSLENAAIKYGLGHKIDVIKEEYWNKGINTDAVPQGILSEYCIQDVELTYRVYQQQVEQFNKLPQLYRLFKLMCQDLLVLEEMEYNGLVFNPELCHSRSATIDVEIKELNETLAKVYPDLSINFGSGDQLSAFLYGGEIYEDGKEHIGFFKTGEKKGQPKYKNITITHPLPRLVEPLKGTEVKKVGTAIDGSPLHFWKTSEDILRKLKGPNAKKYVGPLLRLSELEKLNSTYFKGIPKINQENFWPMNKLHGQFNQCVTQTGRLSSSKPNLQNFSGDCLDVLISRYDE